MHNGKGNFHSETLSLGMNTPRGTAIFDPPPDLR
jgi:hypothetical protein